jgi:hypothetical protein
MSLILAPDKSKLSKRHGATSVGDFKAQVRTAAAAAAAVEPGVMLSNVLCKGMRAFFSEPPGCCSVESLDKFCMCSS